VRKDVEEKHDRMLLIIEDDSEFARTLVEAAHDRGICYEAKLAPVPGQFRVVQAGGSEVQQATNQGTDLRGGITAEAGCHGRTSRTARYRQIRQDYHCRWDIRE
jgi:hypothetical protein